MPDQIPDLKAALISHRAKLTLIQAMSKIATPRMQQLMTISLQAFDNHIDSWAKLAPMDKFIKTYDKHYKGGHHRS